MSQKNLWGFQADKEIPSPPRAIVEEYCENLAELTNGLVIAKAKPYAGYTTDYERTHPNFMAMLSQGLSPKITVEQVSIQEDLGSLGDTSSFTHEFFITSEYVHNYKYRIMFFAHFPYGEEIVIVLDERIADDINLSQRIDCTNKEDFEAKLQRIIVSKPVQTVINTLYAMAKEEIELEEKETAEIPF
ncbi:MAG: hypothetical protein FWG65_07050 [Turicibacter sp.]|nr:hypothetical protein [Turicibacter sp.]